MPLDIHREMAAFQEALRAQGLSATRQRLRLAQIVFSRHQHFSADDLIGWAQKEIRGVGRVTVYRTLKVLVDAGLVEERSFRPGRIMYEHVVGHRHHDHMVCLSCQNVIEFSNPRIEEEQARSARSHAFTLVHHHHTLFGYCRKCAPSALPGGTPGAGRRPEGERASPPRRQNRK